MQNKQEISQATNELLRNVETDNLDEVLRGFASMARVEIISALSKGTLIIHGKK